MAKMQKFNLFAINFLLIILFVKSINCENATVADEQYHVVNFLKGLTSNDMNLAITEADLNDVSSMTNVLEFFLDVSSRDKKAAERFMQSALMPLHKKHCQKGVLKALNKADKKYDFSFKELRNATREGGVCMDPVMHDFLFTNLKLDPYQECVALKRFSHSLRDTAFNKINKKTYQNARQTAIQMDLLRRLEQLKYEIQQLGPFNGRRGMMTPISLEGLSPKVRNELARIALRCFTGLVDSSDDTEDEEALRHEAQKACIDELYDKMHENIDNEPMIIDVVQGSDNNAAGKESDEATNAKYVGESKDTKHQAEARKAGTGKQFSDMETCNNKTVPSQCETPCKSLNQILEVKKPINKWNKQKANTKKTHVGKDDDDGKDDDGKDDEDFEHQMQQCNKQKANTKKPHVGKDDDDGKDDEDFEHQMQQCNKQKANTKKPHVDKDDDDGKDDDDDEDFEHQMQQCNKQKANTKKPHVGKDDDDGKDDENFEHQMQQCNKQKANTKKPHVGKDDDDGKDDDGKDDEDFDVFKQPCRQQQLTMEQVETIRAFERNMTKNNKPMPFPFTDYGLRDGVKQKVDNVNSNLRNQVKSEARRAATGREPKCNIQKGCKKNGHGKVDRHNGDFDIFQQPCHRPQHKHLKKVKPHDKRETQTPSKKIEAPKTNSSLVANVEKPTKNGTTVQNTVQAEIKKNPAKDNTHKIDPYNAKTSESLYNKFRKTALKKGFYDSKSASGKSSESKVSDHKPQEQQKQQLAPKSADGMHATDKKIGVVNNPPKWIIKNAKFKSKEAKTEQNVKSHTNMQQPNTATATKLAMNQPHVDINSVNERHETSARSSPSNNVYDGTNLETPDKENAGFEQQSTSKSDKLLISDAAVTDWSSYMKDPSNELTSNNAFDGNHDKLDQYKPDNNEDNNLYKYNVDNNNRDDGYLASNNRDDYSPANNWNDFSPANNNLYHCNTDDNSNADNNLYHYSADDNNPNYNNPYHYNPENSNLNQYDPYHYNPIYNISDTSNADNNNPYNYNPVNNNQDDYNAANNRNNNPYHYNPENSNLNQYNPYHYNPIYNNSDTNNADNNNPYNYNPVNNNQDDYNAANNRNDYNPAYNYSYQYNADNSNPNQYNAGNNNRDDYNLTNNRNYYNPAYNNSYQYNADNSNPNQYNAGNNNREVYNLTNNRSDYNLAYKNAHQYNIANSNPYQYNADNSNPNQYNAGNNNRDDNNLANNRNDYNPANNSPYHYNADNNNPDNNPYHYSTNDNPNNNNPYNYNIDNNNLDYNNPKNNSSYRYNLDNYNPINNNTYHYNPDNSNPNQYNPYHYNSVNNNSDYNNADSDNLNNKYSYHYNADNSNPDNNNADNNNPYHYKPAYHNPDHNNPYNYEPNNYLTTAAPYTLLPSSIDLTIPDTYNYGTTDNSNSNGNVNYLMGTSNTGSLEPSEEYGNSMGSANDNNEHVDNSLDVLDRVEQPNHDYQREYDNVMSSANDNNEHVDNSLDVLDRVEQPNHNYQHDNSADNHYDSSPNNHYYAANTNNGDAANNGDADFKAADSQNTDSSDYTNRVPSDSTNNKYASHSLNQDYNPSNMATSNQDNEYNNRNNLENMNTPLGTPTDQSLATNNDYSAHLANQKQCNPDTNMAISNQDNDYNNRYNLENMNRPLGTPTDQSLATNKDYSSHLANQKQCNPDTNMATSNQNNDNENRNGLENIKRSPGAPTNQNLANTENYAPLNNNELLAIRTKRYLNAVGAKTQMSQEVFQKLQNLYTTMPNDVFVSFVHMALTDVPENEFEKIIDRIARNSNDEFKKFYDRTPEQLDTDRDLMEKFIHEVISPEADQALIDRFMNKTKPSLVKPLTKAEDKRLLNKYLPGKDQKPAPIYYAVDDNIIKTKKEYNMTPELLNEVDGLLLNKILHGHEMNVSELNPEVRNSLLQYQLGKPLSKEEDEVLLNKILNKRTANVPIKREEEQQQGQLAEQQGQVAEQQGQLTEQQGQLAEQQGQLTEQQGQLAEQQDNEDEDYQRWAIDSAPNGPDGRKQRSRAQTLREINNDNQLRGCPCEQRLTHQKGYRISGYGHGKKNKNDDYDWIPFYGNSHHGHKKPKKLHGIEIPADEFIKNLPPTYVETEEPKKTWWGGLNPLQFFSKNKKNRVRIGLHANKNEEDNDDVEVEKIQTSNDNDEAVSSSNRMHWRANKDNDEYMDMEDNQSSNNDEKAITLSKPALSDTHISEKPREENDDYMRTCSQDNINWYPNYKQSQENGFKKYFHWFSPKISADDEATKQETELQQNVALRARALPAAHNLTNENSNNLAYFADNDAPPSPQEIIRAVHELKLKHPTLMKHNFDVLKLTKALAETTAKNLPRSPQKTDDEYIGEDPNNCENKMPQQNDEAEKSNSTDSKDMDDMEHRHRVQQLIGLFKLPKLPMIKEMENMAKNISCDEKDQDNQDNKDNQCNQEQSKCPDKKWQQTIKECYQPGQPNQPMSNATISRILNEIIKSKEGQRLTKALAETAETTAKNLPRSTQTTDDKYIGEDPNNCANKWPQNDEAQNSNPTDSKDKEEDKWHRFRVEQLIGLFKLPKLPMIKEMENMAKNITCDKKNQGQCPDSSCPDNPCKQTIKDFCHPDQSNQPSMYNATISRILNEMLKPEEEQGEKPTPPRQRSYTTYQFFNPVLADVGQPLTQKDINRVMQQQRIQSLMQLYGPFKLPATSTLSQTFRGNERNNHLDHVNRLVDIYTPVKLGFPKHNITNHHRYDGHVKIDDETTNSAAEKIDEATTDEAENEVFNQRRSRNDNILFMQAVFDPIKNQKYIDNMGQQQRVQSLLQLYGPLKLPMIDSLERKFTKPTNTEAEKYVTKVNKLVDLYGPLNVGMPKYNVSNDILMTETHAVNEENASQADNNARRFIKNKQFKSPQAITQELDDIVTKQRVLKLIDLYGPPKIPSSQLFKIPERLNPAKDYIDEVLLLKKMFGPVNSGQSKFNRTHFLHGTVVNLPSPQASQQFDHNTVRDETKTDSDVDMTNNNQYQLQVSKNYHLNGPVAPPIINTGLKSQFNIDLVDANQEPQQQQQPADVLPLSPEEVYNRNLLKILTRPELNVLLGIYSPVDYSHHIDYHKNQKKAIEPNQSQLDADDNADSLAQAQLEQERQRQDALDRVLEWELVRQANEKAAHYLVAFIKFLKEKAAEVNEVDNFFETTKSFFDVMQTPEGYIRYLGNADFKDNKQFFEIMSAYRALKEQDEKERQQQIDLENGAEPAMTPEEQEELEKEDEYSRETQEFFKGMEQFMDTPVYYKPRKYKSKKVHRKDTSAEQIAAAASKPFLQLTVAKMMTPNEQRLHYVENFLSAEDEFFTHLAQVYLEREVYDDSSLSAAEYVLKQKHDALENKRFQEEQQRLAEEAKKKRASTPFRGDDSRSQANNASMMSVYTVPVVPHNNYTLEDIRRMVTEELSHHHEYFYNRSMFAGLGRRPNANDMLIATWQSKGVLPSNNQQENRNLSQKKNEIFQQRIPDSSFLKLDDVPAQKNDKEVQQPIQISKLLKEKIMKTSKNSRESDDFKLSLDPYNNRYPQEQQQLQQQQESQKQQPQQQQQMSNNYNQQLAEARRRAERRLPLITALVKQKHAFAAARPKRQELVTAPPVGTNVDDDYLKNLAESFPSDDGMTYEISENTRMKRLKARRQRRRRGIINESGFIDKDGHLKEIDLSANRTIQQWPNQTISTTNPTNN